MGKLEKSFYWLCLAFTIYITIGFKIIPAVLKDQLIKNLDENLTQKTTIEKIEFNPFSFNVKVHGFKLSDSNDIPTILFKEFSIDFGVIKSIENLNVSFENIALVDAMVNIIEEKDGNLNLTKLVKPQENEPEIKEEDPNSKILNFLVSKLTLENANINYINQEEIPYSLSLNNINYTLYDLGTFKNILSSNDLKFKLNEHTNITIGGAFKLEPFRGYGKISIEDLRLKELLTYKKDLLNFDLDEKANLNLNLNYDFHANKDFALNINSEKFEFNNINLKQSKNDILSLEKLDIKTFVFNLDKQNIRLDNINFNALKANMISDKSGINFANLIKEEKTTPEVKTTQEEVKVAQEEDSKPWNIDLANIKINNSDFVFDDKVNNSLAQTKAFNISLDALIIKGSDIDLSSLKLANPNLSYSDNKNKLSISSKNANINLDKLTLKQNILDINKIEISKDNFVLNDKKANFSLLTKKTNISLNNLKIDNGKTSINSITLKTPSLNFDDVKSKIKVQTSDINLNVNSLLINGNKTSINSIGLKTPSIKFDDAKSEMKVQTTNIDFDLNSLLIDGKKTSINSIGLKTPKLNFDDIKSKMKVATSDINLVVNSLLINDSKISLKNIKLLKPSVNLIDSTNNININAHDIELYISNLTKVDNKLAIESVKLIEPNLDFLDTNSNTRIEAKNLDLKIKNLSNNNSGFKIEKTDLDQPNISITLPKNNVVKEVEAKISETKTVEIKDKENTTSQTKVNIGPVNINNATFSFEDKNLPVPFKTMISNLNGKISEFKNTESSTTNLEVNGIVDKYGVAKITGIVHPNNIKILTDINMIFNNIAIQNFTPYSGKFVGREIKSGKLDLNLKYNIQKSNLEAKNNITITKIELGKNVQSPDAVSLPLDIAIALLKNSKGIIDIKLPVSGNVDDPQFSIGAIVWNAFINLMTKAVTAPFSLLGAIFNFSEDEIKSVKFNLAEDKITPIQKETLDKISQILVAKPDLAIKISASYDKQKEEYALKMKKYLDKNPDAKNLKREELKKLASNEDATVEELESIAKNRIQNIEEYLIKEKSIDSKQVILTDKIKTTSSSIDLGIDKIK